MELGLPVNAHRSISTRRDVRICALGVRNREVHRVLERGRVEVADAAREYRVIISKSIWSAVLAEHAAQIGHSLAASERPECFLPEKLLGGIVGRRRTASAWSALAL